MYEHPSRMVAKVNMIEGEISWWFCSTALSRFSVVS